MQRESTVLILEAPPTAQRLGRYLEAIGLRVRVATSSRQAMQLLRSDIFDRAIVSVELGMDETAILSRLASLPATRVLVATGPAGDPELERRAGAAGANVYLARPLDVEALAQALAWAPGAISPRAPAADHPPGQGRSRGPPKGDPEER